VSIVIFLGPTLPVEAARRELDATYLGPVSQGDVYRAALEDPWAIGIVDGFFERVPAVWHKEILAAMARGVHVYGAASMGALRAAELDAYGMVGVGRIFRDFRDGVLEDDDEVAVVHAPAEFGYQSLSVAMVDIRATVAKATKAGVIHDSLGDVLVDSGKALHYTERTFERVLEGASGRGARSAAIADFRTWLPRGRVEQKKRDALAMLRAIRRHRATDDAPMTAGFHFEHTDAWEQVRSRSGREQMASFRSDTSGALILDELSLEPGMHLAAREFSFARTVALAEADRLGIEVDLPLLREAVNAFRLEQGLADPEAVQGWLGDRELDPDGFSELMQREARLRRLRETVAPNVGPQLLDFLRLSGRYRRVVERARAKERRLAELGLDNPGLETAPVDQDELLRWFFLERRGEQVPVDLGAQALRMGYADPDALIQSLLREYYYVTTERGA
jgi:hypothetical protein